MSGFGGKEKWMGLLRKPLQPRRSITSSERMSTATLRASLFSWD